MTLSTRYTTPVGIAIIDPQAGPGFRLHPNPIEIQRSKKAAAAHNRRKTHRGRPPESGGQPTTRTAAPTARPAAQAGHQDAAGHGRTSRDGDAASGTSQRVAAEDQVEMGTGEDDTRRAAAAPPTPPPNQARRRAAPPRAPRQRREGPAGGWGGRRNGQIRPGGPRIRR